MILFSWTVASAALLVQGVGIGGRWFWSLGWVEGGAGGPGGTLLGRGSCVVVMEAVVREEGGEKEKLGRVAEKKA